MVRTGARREEDAMQDTGPDERMTVADAAERLGISKEAVRKRIARGTLRADKDRDGMVRVYIPASDTADHLDAVGQMRARIEDLREQLESERQAHAEARRIIAGLVERIPPQLEPPREEARESPVSRGPSDTPTDTTDAGGGAQEPSERRWWEFWR
jgi:excisionase family DNA binding protein